MSSKSLRNTPTSVLLIVLAVMDTSVLWLGLSRQWIQYTFPIQDIRLVSNVTCKLHTFLVYWSTHYAGWILVCIACERLLIIHFPFWSKNWITKQTVIKSVIILGVLLFFLNFHFFFLLNLSVVTDKNSNETKIASVCEENEKGRHFLMYTWPWIDFSFFSLIPFVILFISNFAIIARLIWINSIRRHRLNSQTNQTSKVSHMTVIQFSVSAWFFLTTLPISLFLLKQQAWEDTQLTSEQRQAKLLEWAIVVNASYLNNSFNFPLYVLSSYKFRRELTLLFCRRLGQVVPDTQNQTNELL